MPTETPYPFDGVIYDTDEAVEADVAVTIENLTSTTHETASTTTNSVGEYSLNAAHFTSGYSDNDVIYVFARKGRRSEWYKTSIDEAKGSETKNLYLKPNSIYWKSYTAAAKPMYRVYSLTLTNVDESNDRYVNFEDENGDVLLRANVPVKTTLNLNFNGGRKFFGSVRVLEDGTGGLIPAHSGANKLERVVLCEVIS